MQRDFNVQLAVESYIAHPYWEETERLVNILKKSGMNSGRSGEAKRAEKLRNYLSTIGMTAEEFEALKARAECEWYKDAAGAIFIPRHHMSGCLVNALLVMASNARPFKDPGGLRSQCQISDFATGRSKHDRVWVRFVRPTKDGKPLSNQRSERRNQVLERFTASGTLSFDPGEIDSNAEQAIEKMVRLVQYAGKYVGVGASRKMGFGRFTVADFSAAD